MFIQLYIAKVPIGSRSGENFPAPDPTKKVQIRIRNPGFMEGEVPDFFQSLFKLINACAEFQRFSIKLRLYVFKSLSSHFFTFIWETHTFQFFNFFLFSFSFFFNVLYTTLQSVLNKWYILRVWMILRKADHDIQNFLLCIPSKLLFSLFLRKGQSLLWHSTSFTLTPLF